MKIATRECKAEYPADEIHVTIGPCLAFNVGILKNGMVWVWCKNCEAGGQGIQIQVGRVVDALDALIKQEFKRNKRKKPK